MICLHEWQPEDGLTDHMSASYNSDVMQGDNTTNGAQNIKALRVPQPDAVNPIIGYNILPTAKTLADLTAGQTVDTTDAANSVQGTPQTLQLTAAQAVFPGTADSVSCGFYYLHARDFTVLVFLLLQRQSQIEFMLGKTQQLQGLALTNSGQEHEVNRELMCLLNCQCPSYLISAIFACRHSSLLYIYHSHHRCCLAAAAMCFSLSNNSCISNIWMTECTVMICTPFTLVTLDLLSTQHCFVPETCRTTD